MFIIGIINDAKMAKEILEEYTDREIKGHYFFSQTDNANVIAVENQEHIEIAMDIYRVHLGLKKPQEIDPEWIKIKSIPKGKWTKNITFFCVLIYLISFFPWGTGLFHAFQIDSHTNGFLLDVTHGQIWRIITPIFLHMNFLHILFNMLWLLDLGSIFEYKFSRNHFFAFVVVSGIFSNLLQYTFKGASFGGMSGVIYGMLGFLWVNKKLNTEFEFTLPKHDIILMIGWFFLCLVGIFPNIANFAHAGGLIVGIIWAIYLNFKINFETIKYFIFAIALLIITILIETNQWQFRYN